jgi:transmembrane sensor
VTVVNLMIFGLFTYRGVQGYTTATGEQQSVPLGHGSVMDLDTRTSVTVVPGRYGQDIYVWKGQVHFRLTHDDSMRTTVHAGDLKLTDIGTEFDVRVHESGRTSVMVAQGIVNADALQTADSADIAPTGRPPQTRTHVAANTAVLSNEYAWTERIGSTLKLRKVWLPKAEVERRMSWRLGILRFSRDPLVDVVAEVNRYNRTQITLDNSVRNCPITGTYTIGRDLPMFIRFIESLGCVDAHRVTPEEIALKPRNSVWPQGNPSRTPAH